MGEPNGAAPEVAVAVTTNEVPDEPNTAPPSETVVVTPPGPDHTEILVGMSTLVGSMAERMQRIEDAVVSAQSSADNAATTAAVAQMDAVDAQIAAGESVAAAELAVEQAQPEPVEEPPAKTHWLDRSFSEWRGSRKRK
jgi:hypothetical protein